MDKNSRPDAIIRAQMPESSRGSPFTPVVLAILAIVFFFILLFLFMGIIPYEAVKGGEKASENLDARINQAEAREINTSENAGTLFAGESEIPAQPDPIISRLEQPFVAEEEREERQTGG
jgi:hypothetical protein